MIKQPHALTQEGGRPSNAPAFAGPYKVTSVVGEVAYECTLLPRGPKISTHISRIKPYHAYARLARSAPYVHPRAHTRPRARRSQEISSDSEHEPPSPSALSEDQDPHIPADRDFYPSEPDAGVPMDIDTTPSAASAPIHQPSRFAPKPSRSTAPPQVPAESPAAAALSRNRGRAQPIYSDEYAGRVTSARHPRDTHTRYTHELGLRPGLRPTHSVRLRR
jgi:hypothetical protein